MVDLFCGAGGMSSGFQKAGHEIILGIDINGPALETYAFNHPDSKVIESDIKDISKLPKADIIIGGPPCPEFSTAKPDRDPEKGMELVEEYLRLINLSKPKYWIMENVRGIRKHITHKRFPKIKILNCADFGVPQTRIRCFAGKYKTPVQTHAETPSNKLTGGKLQRWRTVRDAIGDLPSPVLSHKRSKKGDDVTGQPYYHLDQPAHTIATFPPRLVKPEGRALDYLRNHVGAKAYPYDRGESFHNWGFPAELDIPMRTITASICNDASPHWYIPMDDVIDNPSKTRLTSRHKRRLRRLTVREVARLQSFDDSFIFKGSVTSQYRQVGNAVPPLMAYSLAIAMNKQTKRID